MSPLRTLIVDDEILGRENLRWALQAYPRWQVCAEAASAVSALTAIDAHDIDVVFLDIRMPGQSGLELARQLSLRAAPPLLIFVTAYEQHALEAFELHALDYLKKPFSDERLALTLERAERMIEQGARARYGDALRGYLNDLAPPARYWQRVSVRSVGSIEVVELRDLTHIEAQGNYVSLHLPTRHVLFRASMTQMEQHLDPQWFLRIHRSTIVRLDQVVALRLSSEHGYLLQLKSGSRLSVSERYVAALKAALQSRPG